MRTKFLILCCVTVLASSNARAAVAPGASPQVKACNSKSAKIDDAAELPTEFDDAPFDAPSAAPLVGPTDVPPAPAPRIPRLDLSYDLASLSPLSGPTISDAPVLLLRLENLPNFDARRHCNRVFPILSKPDIAPLGDGRIRASLGRYSIEYPLKGKPTGWLHTPLDTTGRLFWIFPRYFGRGSDAAWLMAKSYDAAFQQSAPGSNRRAWLAESFLNLAMRHYWDLDQKKLYPAGPLPGAHELSAAFQDRTGVDCAAQPGDFFCLGPKVLAANEVGHGGGKPSPEAFRTSDAVYSGSGLTVGLQQIDIAAASKLEKALMRKWMPLTLGRRASYRAPIRLWTIDELNRWYGGDAAVANGELGSASARSAILMSYVDHFIRAKVEWDSQISTAYPGWKAEWRTALAIAATDIANVTGYRMKLPPLAADVCQVLEFADPRPKGGRTNALMLSKSDTAPRLLRMKHIVQPIAGFEDVDWRCIPG